MVKRKLADEIAELLNPAAAKEADPDSFGDDAAKVAEDDEQLERLTFDLHGSKQAKESRTRLRAAIDVDDAEYRGRRTSRAAIFGEDDGSDDGSGSEEEGEGDAGADGGVSGRADVKSLDSRNSDEHAEFEEGSSANDSKSDDDDDDGDDSEDDGEDDGEGDGKCGSDDDAGALQRRQLAAADAAASNELSRLEQEYGQLQAQEETTVAAIRARGDKERAKGRAVANQQHLYDRALEARIVLQKALNLAARLPLASVGNIANATGGAAAGARQLGEAQARLPVLRDAALHAIGDLVALQAALLCRHDGAMAHVNEEDRGALSALVPPPAAAAGGDGDGDGGGDGDAGEATTGAMAPCAPASAVEAWQQMEALRCAFAPFRDASLDRWHRRTVLLGAGSIKGGSTQLKALNQSISAQMQSAMRDPAKLIQRSRLPPETCPRPLGEPDVTAPGSDASNDAAPTGPTSDSAPSATPATPAAAAARWVEHSYDDGEFYQQLLREFLTREGAAAGGGGAAARAGAKRRKVVDRRASKGRKIRYHVHEKLVSFMAPAPGELPAFAEQLFANLFGSRAALADA